MDYDYSPTALKKVVYAGTQATSFPQGSRDLKELAELDVSAERVRRATERIGEERLRLAAVDHLGRPRGFPKRGL